VDTKEIAEFTEALNTLNKFHQFEYDISQITCSDSEMSRKEILSQFSTSEKRQLLFSVRILDEGIDIPSCDSIFITYPSKSKIRTIQRLNRCTRIDKANPFKIGNIFLWCDEYEEILGTLCELKEYDPFFKDKISVSNIDYYGNTDKKQLQKDDEEVLSDLVYKVGMKAYVPKEWRERFNDLRKFVIENKILPSSESSDPYVKSLGKWRKDQQWNYKYEIRNMKIGAVLRDTWSDFMAEFPELHLSGDEKWEKRLLELRKYVIANKKLPSSKSSDPYVKSLGEWRNTQQHNCNNEKYNMIVGAAIRDAWSDLVDEFPKLFLSGDEKWKYTLAEAEKYIIANNELPSLSNDDPDIKFLGRWLNTQQQNYKNEKQIMKNIPIRDIWISFIKKYEKHFISADEKWKYTLAEVEKYIIANYKLPTPYDDDPDIKSLGTWLDNQRRKSKNEKGIMKNVMIRDIWINFTKKYEKHFISADEKWKSTLAEVEKYIIANHILPSRSDNDPDIKFLGRWLSQQQQNYKNDKQIMKNVMIRDIWKKFTKKYKKLFMSADEKWKSTLAEVEEYIIANDELPSRSDNDPDIKFLGRWLNAQQRNYKNEKQIMKNIMIRDIWINFKNKHEKYFSSNDKKLKLESPSDTSELLSSQ
jgi:DNA-directed RNA polymerase subunit H (RpoH/RPB5)